MIRPPSNLRAYDDFWSGDPAVVQLPDDATDEQRKDHDHALEIARETGDWSAILVPGEEPTRFVMQPLKGAMFRRLLDAVVSRRVGQAEANHLAFRAAIENVVNFGQVKIAMVNHDMLGKIADQKIADAFDAIDVSIVNELGARALLRARGPDPK